MPLLGQASGGWGEGSSALRLLNLGIRNSIGVLTDDSFTQHNPVSQVLYPSTRVDTTKTGVLGGSVAFVRPDGGTNHIGGPGTAAEQAAWAVLPAQVIGFRPLGLFENSANGNPYENTPGVASGCGPYVCAMGTYGDALYETRTQAISGAIPAGTAITWYTGVNLMASVNGFLTPAFQIVGGAAQSMDVTGNTAEMTVNTVGSTVLGVLKMVPDAVQTELVFDARL